MPGQEGRCQGSRPPEPAPAQDGDALCGSPGREEAKEGPTGPSAAGVMGTAVGTCPSALRQSRGGLGWSEMPLICPPHG